ncbi:MAG: ATP-binding cassette domain-containing protein [Brachymonas sp.]|jgi:ABC-2 type transport system ATP-binding protein|nr:ATP-binding cassette domain-containing protein [Brachymonas sp.]MBP6138181.1 ATP-binding cassette domain-containing protein [Brachymonas sp.]MBP7246417.1 ATP-binding cassette domain-containing protein [Brachymonas sp.]MBP7740329.1 ATP-binding cassette domain-containing protein [Brachymonas sp.]MBP9590044.1 ATP-binding cassette domain-containing protein [Brachymonas sp.]
MTSPPAPVALPQHAGIHIESLMFGYGKQPLFTHFNASLQQAGIYGLFGRNGSGKSTLLKILAGLLAPHAGRVDVLGYVPRQRAAEFLCQMYILPEEFHLPNLTPDSLRRTHAGFYPRFSAALFGIYLHELDVPANQTFGAMSLGQKKKAAIAFALATQTPLLLMDEPTNGLDIVSRAQFKRLMARPEQQERLVLISTHQAHDLESILGHVWFIDQGQLVLSWPMFDLPNWLSMGVASDAASLPPPAVLLYQEPIGQQIAWVARRVADGTSAASAASAALAPSPVQLELLYKALSLNKDAVLAALPSGNLTSKPTCKPAYAPASAPPFHPQGKP